MFSVITNIYNKKSNFLQPQENWKKFFFLQLEMFDVCTRGDTAHIDTIFKLLPHTRQLPHHRIVHKLLEQHPSQRTHSLHRRTPDLQPTTYTNRTIHHIAVTTVLPSWKWANDCPKYVELIQGSIKLLLLHLVGHLYNSPTLMMHGQTQIKYVKRFCFEVKWSEVNVSSWSFILFTYIDDARSNTNQICEVILFWSEVKWSEVMWSECI